LENYILNLVLHSTYTADRPNRILMLLLIHHFYIKYFSAFLKSFMLSISIHFVPVIPVIIVWTFSFDNKINSDFSPTVRIPHLNNIRWNLEYFIPCFCLSNIYIYWKHITLLLFLLEAFWQFYNPIRCHSVFYFQDSSLNIPLSIRNIISLDLIIIFHQMYLS